MMTTCGLFERVEKAYVTATDITQLDIARWFLKQLNELTDLPIYCYIIGNDEQDYISEELKDLARIEYADRISSPKYLDDTHPSHPWFMKPSIIKDMLDVYTDQVVWLDTDIELFKSPDVLFEMIEEGKLLMAEDWHAINVQKMENMHNSGVVGVMSTQRGVYQPEILNKWVQSCWREDRRGDQECLWALLNRVNDFSCIKTMDQRYHNQRLNPSVDADRYALHWTGPTGKEHIRENLV